MRRAARAMPHGSAVCDTTMAIPRSFCVMKRDGRTIGRNTPMRETNEKKKPSSAICSYVRCSVFCFNKTHTSMTFQWIPSAATAATAAMAQHWMNVVMPFGADARCHIQYCTRMCVFIVPVAIQNAFNIIRLRVQCMFCWVGVPVLTVRPPALAIDHA